MYVSYVCRASQEAMNKLISVSSLRNELKEYFALRDYGVVRGLVVGMDSFDVAMGLAPSISKLRKSRDSRVPLNPGNPGNLVKLENLYSCGIGLSFSALCEAQNQHEVRQIVIGTWIEELPKVITNRKIFDIDRFLLDLAKFPI